MSLHDGLNWEAEIAYVKELKVEAAAQAAHDKTLVDATVERCCAAMCPSCKRGDPLGEHRVSHQYGEYSYGECLAAPIRRMVAGQ